MSFDLKNLVATRMGENYELHTRHLNPTLVEVLRITGFDKVYVRAEGAYLYDSAGHEYLDFLSGYGVFNMGRNHPTIKKAIRDTLDLDLPNMVQLDCSLLSGLLAEALLKKLPSHLEAVFFCNSGTEAIEGAIKFARAATGRSKIHQPEGVLSRSFVRFPFRDGQREFSGRVSALFGRRGTRPARRSARVGKAFEERDVAAFLLEPVQGKGRKLSGRRLLSESSKRSAGRTERW